MPYYPSPDVYIKPEVTEAQLGYLAGIIDGDGCIVHNASATKGTEAGISVSMTDHDVIDWLRTNFAGRANYGRVLPSGKRMKTWVLFRTADLRYVLPRLIPYLVCKRDQAMALLVYVEHSYNKPRYQTPTRSVGNRERARRRIINAEWKDKRAKLRNAIRDAR